MVAHSSRLRATLHHRADGADGENAFPSAERPRVRAMRRCSMICRMLGDLDTFQRRLLSWYQAHRRDLPWRPPRGSAQRTDPYHVLVSETMLQQTQVATVVPYFRRFLERFPTVQDLAAADEQDVLRMWQGLGYYSRARNLQGAARMIVERFGGQVPATVDDLLKLPGVGRYTAGAVASIAHEVRAPILDGNVMRVLCRLDAVQTDPRTPKAQQALWKRAEQILPDQQIGDFNSALMELGATVCTPCAPSCLLCPVREHCAARAAGIEQSIPPAKRAQPTPLNRRWVLAIEHDGKFLMQQRPPQGRWAAMWQFVTLEAASRRPSARDLASRIGATPVRVEHLGQVKHALTHRRYEFDVYYCPLAKDASAGAIADNLSGTWLTPQRIESIPLPKPQVKVMELVTEARRASGQAQSGCKARSRQAETSAGSGRSSKSVG